MEEADGADGDTVVEHNPKGSRWVLVQSVQDRVGDATVTISFFLSWQSYPALLPLAPYMTQVSGDQDSPRAGQTQLRLLPEDCLLTSKTAYRQIAGRKHKTK